MDFDSNIAREDYDSKTGEYIPEWKRIAKSGIKISAFDYKRGHFGIYSPAYVTTNEDWRFAMQELKPAGKTVLTVAASGDQPIAFAISGAESIDTFDMSYFAKVIMDIKTAAIQTMTKEQYSNFIPSLYDTTNISELDVYNKIEPVCEKSSINAATQMCGYKIFNHGLGASTKYMPTSKEYRKAKKLVHVPMNFIWSDLNSLHTHLHKKYDIIYLSNIFEYFNKANEITEVLNSLYPYLNPNGQIMIYASWIHTNTSAIIANAATKCDWGRVQAHDIRDAAMLILSRTR